MTMRKIKALSIPCREPQPNVATTTGFAHVIHIPPTVVESGGATELQRHRGISMKMNRLARILLGGLCASVSLWLPSSAFAQDKPIAAPGGSGTTSQPATTTETSVKQESITGAQKTFPAATPEAVIAVTRRIFPAVVRLDVAQAIYS